MIHALLDALRRQQLEQYEEQKIYELDYRNPTVKDSDVLLINLAAEYLGLQKTIELALACHARVVSLILWDPGEPELHPESMVTGQEPAAQSLWNGQLWNFRQEIWI